MNKSEKRFEARMNKDEKKWEARKAKIEKFKTKLKELMEKYGFGKSESDNYDGMEEYCGTNYYFVIDDEPWHNESIEDIIKECIYNFKPSLKHKRLWKFK